MDCVFSDASMRIFRLNISDLSDEDYTNAFFDMSCERQKKCKGYRFADDKKRCIAADFLVRKMLCESLDKNTDEIEIYTDENGKPYVNESIYFNLSHSDKYVAAVVADKPVGIDIEKIKSVKSNMLDYFCSEKDKKYILGEEKSVCEDVPENALERFFEVWTFKEAYLKCTGEGISKKAAVIDFEAYEKYQTVFDGFVLCVFSE
ncbi:MAG: 4'-phosphopantetheinyl transferase superfamily protein [Clostridia bacterium]|nr:4'-phosphopantetheinyl transferase superfamily protein [Clostridia bacterium]